MERIDTLSYYTLQEVCIEILGYCPMNCVHCSSFTPKAYKNILRLETIQAIIDDISLFGTPVLQFSGGEPLCHPRVVDIVEYTERAGLTSCLYTSGIQVVEDNLAPVSKVFVEALARAGLRKVILSLQGATAHTHEVINRTPGTFEKAIESIRRFKEYGLWVGIHFVPMKPNWREIVGLAEMCARLQVDELAILRFVPQGRGGTNQLRLGLSSQESLELISLLHGLKPGFSDRLHIRVGSPLNFCSFYPLSQDEKPGYPTPCNAGIGTCTVLPTGAVVPCPALKHQPEWVAGNVLDTSFARIWQKSSVFTELRTFNYRKLRGPCHDCKFLDICRGRCHAQRIIAWGDIYRGPDPCCPVGYCSLENLFRVDAFVTRESDTNINYPNKGRILQTSRGGSRKSGVS